MRIYPVSETELALLKLWALLSLLIIPVQFFILHALRLVSRLRRHTKFEQNSDTAARREDSADPRSPVGTLYTCTGRWIAPSSVQYDYVCWGAGGSGGDQKPDHKIKLEVM